MSLIDYIKDSLKDEHDANNKYDVMLKLTENDASINEKDKALISGIIFKIKTDEETHKVLLKIIKEVLS